jgi:hypothetical protein
MAEAPRGRLVKLTFEAVDYAADVVNSPNETPEAWSLHKRLIKGILNHHDTRPGGARSTRGQEQNTGGIWGAVTLSAPARVDISRMNVTTRPDKDGAWTVAIDIRLAAAADLEGPLHLEERSAMKKASWCGRISRCSGATTILRNSSGSAITGRTRTARSTTS